MQRFGIVQRTVIDDKPPVSGLRSRPSKRFIELLDEVRRLQRDVDNGEVPVER